MKCLCRSFALAIALALGAAGSLLAAEKPKDAVDPFLPLVCEDRRPEPADPGSYGMLLNGSFRHPSLTPVDEENPHPFPGRLDHYDLGSYIDGLTVEAAYEGPEYTPDLFHTWQNIVDFDGHRYLFQYDRSDGRVYDVTDVKNVKVLESVGRSDVKVDFGVNPERYDGKDWKAHDFWGASSIQWNRSLSAYVMIQSFEQKRQVGELGDMPPHDKFSDPDGVKALRDTIQLKGFKVYRLDGPLKRDWHLLAAVSTDATQADPLRSDYERAPQQGSGSLDVPYYVGDRYLFIAVAPEDRWGNTEYPNYLYSAGYQSWDVSDPIHPKLLDTWHRRGQVKGEEDGYRKNSRCGNRTSWMGSRMPLFIPRPVEEGGKYGFAAMGGLGFSILDISDPGHMKEVGHIDLPPSVSGTEADNIDVSQYEKTGFVYLSGYPLTEDCYEPYKEIFQIDARDPASPRIVGTLPRPRPPESAPFTDFCQRRGSFGPKRTGYYTSPGDPRPGLLIYAFYNAGVQVFDVSDGAAPRIVAYFVPKAYGKDTPDYGYGNQTHGVYVEYDRNVIWTFTNHGFYALSAEKLLGTPNLGPPVEPFRTSAR
jgi:LVIVD repeat